MPRGPVRCSETSGCLGIADRVAGRLTARSPARGRARRGRRSGCAASAGRGLTLRSGSTWESPLIVSCARPKAVAMTMDGDGGLAEVEGGRFDGYVGSSRVGEAALGAQGSGGVLSAEEVGELAAGLGQLGQRGAQRPEHLVDVGRVLEPGSGSAGGVVHRAGQLVDLPCDDAPRSAVRRAPRGPRTGSRCGRSRVAPRTGGRLSGRVGIGVHASAPSRRAERRRLCRDARPRTFRIRAGGCHDA